MLLPPFLPPSSHSPKTLCPAPIICSNISTSERRLAEQNAREQKSRFQSRDTTPETLPKYQNVDPHLFLHFKANSVQKKRIEKKKSHDTPVQLLNSMNNQISLPLLPLPVTKSSISDQPHCCAFKLKHSVLSDLELHQIGPKRIQLNMQRVSRLPHTKLYHGLPPCVFPPEQPSS